MKILFITDNFPPETNAPATRLYEHAQEWIKDSDVELTIVTCAPNFPVGKVFDGYKNKLYQKEEYGGITVIRLWSYIAKNEGFAKRVLDYLSFSFTSFIFGLFHKFDVVIATSPQFFTTWSACALGYVKCKPWIFELRDLWPESIKTVGAMKQGLAIDILEKIEIALYKDADVIIPVTDAFKTNLISRGIDSSKISVVTNGSNIELFSPREKNKEILSRLNLGNKFVIGYIGTHGLAHSLDFIVNSVSKIKDESIHFLFIGDGAVKQSVVELANKLELTNVTFLNSVSKNEVPEYLSICDVSLAPLKKDDNFKTVIPSKIFEAAAMLKPTLLGVEGQAQEIIEKYGSGVCFEPENSVDFIEKIYMLKNSADFYKSCQDGCKKLAVDYDRKVLAAKMLDIIKSVGKSQ